MSLVVFTGGARSGKSTAAQALARRRQLAGAHVVVVVFGRESDGEMAARIAKHRADRPEGFETLVATDPASWLEKVRTDQVLVVECLGTMVGRILEIGWERFAGMAADAEADQLPDGLEDEVMSRALDIVGRLAEREGDTIVVTNEVGDGVVPAYPSGRLFRDVVGASNRTLIDRADAAYLCVAGRLFDLSALPREVRWPED